jgi:hypothetical protein
MCFWDGARRVSTLRGEIVMILLGDAANLLEHQLSERLEAPRWRSHPLVATSVVAA